MAGDVTARWRSGLRATFARCRRGAAGGLRAGTDGQAAAGYAAALGAAGAALAGDVSSAWADPAVLLTLAGAALAGAWFGAFLAPGNPGALGISALGLAGGGIAVVLLPAIGLALLGGLPGWAAASIGGFVLTLTVGLLFGT